MRLAIITTHPIQYNAPLFKMLHERGIVQTKVFYTWGKQVLEKKFDPGFKKNIQWDIPLLDGYEYEFLNNVSKKPGSHHFRGIINPGIINKIKIFQPTTILVYGWSYQSHLKVLTHFKNRIPILFKGDSTLLDESKFLKKIFRKFFLTWVYKHIDYALYLGKNNKDYFIEYGLKSDQLKYSPHAVENSRFAISKEALSNRTEYYIMDDDVVLLFAGKLEPKKNPLLLFDIMKRINNPKLKLLIVGDGELANEVDKLSSTDDRVKYVGFKNQSKMPCIYQMADIFILPSKGPGETWGLALNEAMAAGCSVIASSKVGGAIDLIEENVNGVIFDNDIAPVIQFIEKMLQSKTLLQKAGYSSTKIISGFTLEKNALMIEELCKELNHK